jgi:hypothetical protein
MMYSGLPQLASGAVMVVDRLVHLEDVDVPAR